MIDGALSHLTKDIIMLVFEVNVVLRTGSRSDERVPRTGGAIIAFRIIIKNLYKTTFDYPVVEDYDDLDKYGFYSNLQVVAYTVVAFSSLGWFAIIRFRSPYYDFSKPKESIAYRR